MEKDLTFKEYQEKARTTAIYPNIGSNFTYPLIGLMGEFGEVCEKLKKVIRDKKGEIDEQTLKEIEKEISDVLWYLSNLASELNLSLEHIAEVNIEKLKSRKERGVLHGNGDNR